MRTDGLMMDLFAINFWWCNDRWAREEDVSSFPEVGFQCGATLGDATRQTHTSSLLTGY